MTVFKNLPLWFSIQLVFLVGNVNSLYSQNYNKYSQNYNKGLTYFYKGNYDSAVFFLNKAIKHDSLNSGAYEYRGRSYFNLNKFSDAISDLTTATIRNNGLCDYVTSFSLGMCYYKLKDYKKAMSNFFIAELYYPSDTSVNYMLALCCDKEKDKNCTRYYINKYLEVKPDDEKGLILLAFTYFGRSKNDSAIIFFSKLVDKHPGNKTYLFFRGNAYFQDDNYTKAILDLNHAIELDSNYMEAYYIRANCYYINNQKDKAYLDVAKVESLDPNTDLRKYIKFDK